MACTRTPRLFYEKLGFRRVEGNDEDGWAVVTNGDVRLGLYERQHMPHDRVALNFRGGDVAKNHTDLVNSGVVFEKPICESKSGGKSATFRDPDGFNIFLDTEPGETKKV